MIFLTITFVTSVTMASVIFSNASRKPWLPGPAPRMGRGFSFKLGVFRRELCTRRQWSPQ